MLQGRRSPVLSSLRHHTRPICSSPQPSSAHASRQHAAAWRPVAAALEPGCPAQCADTQLGRSPDRPQITHGVLMLGMMQLVAELTRLGATVIAADASSLILGTGKHDVPGAVG